MCGRCRCSLRPDDIPRACHVPTSSVRHVDFNRYRPMYNVSPGSYLPVLRRDDGGDQGYSAAVHCMKWGLIPSFAKKDDKPDHYRMFNARSESIGDKASFRRLIPKNRCLVPVEGFYEWKKGPKKQPYYIHLKDDHPLVFAALYDSWKNAEGEILYTFTILTTESSSTLQWLHVMNKASFDGPECIKEIVLKEQSNPITNFFSKKRTGEDREESSKIVKSSLKESTDTDLKYGIMEPEMQNSLKLSSTGKSDSETETETKSDVSTCTPTSETKVGGKRNIEEFLTNLKPNFNEVSKPTQTSVKKSKAKDGVKKQATLSSYFV
ncbi:hypothetical protein KSS87_003586 [Heliosperma pusillum]|nr:hypothetical protein KSS87_003586 [Heliosperma pusillum]